MVLEPGGVPGDHSPLWQATGGPFRHEPQQPTPAVLLSVPLPGSRTSQRAPLSLAERPTLRLPSGQFDPQSNSQDHLRTSGDSSSRSILAQTAMVRRPDDSVSVSSMEDSLPLAVSDARLSNTPRPPVVESCRVAIEGDRLRREQVPERVIHTIQAARRPSTTRIYQASWAAYCRFCRAQKVSPRSSSVLHLLSFLQKGLEEGLAPNTLRRQVAAIATVLRPDPLRPISHHPWVRDFLRGASNISPPVIHRFPSWDLPLVLQALTGPPFEPLREVPLRLLSAKVAFLVAITSARRVSELTALSVRPDLCVFHPDRVTLRLDPSFLTKINTRFHRSQDIVLPDFCTHGSHPSELRWHKVDVRRAVKIYIRRTSSFRRSEALFVSFLPASMGNKVSAKTISRWIRSCIIEAYKSSSTPLPARLTAHSTRSAAATAAWTTQAPIEDICRAATWSAPTTFIKHYRLDSFASAEAAFGRRVLQGVCAPAPLVQPVPP